MIHIKKNLKRRTIALIAFSFAVLSFLTLIIFHNFQENHNFENLFLNFNKSIISFSVIEIVVVFLLTAILVVLLSYILISLVAGISRKFRKLYFVLPLVPLYWLLHSFASFVALYEVLTKPHYWAKTTHGKFIN